MPKRRRYCFFTPRFQRKRNSRYGSGDSVQSYYSATSQRRGRSIDSSNAASNNANLVNGTDLVIQPPITVDHTNEELPGISIDFFHGSRRDSNVMAQDVVSMQSTVRTTITEDCTNEDSPETFMDIFDGNRHNSNVTAQNVFSMQNNVPTTAIEVNLSKSVPVSLVKAQTLDMGTSIEASGERSYINQGNREAMHLSSETVTSHSGQSMLFNFSETRNTEPINDYQGGNYNQTATNHRDQSMQFNFTEGRDTEPVNTYQSEHSTQRATNYWDQSMQFNFTQVRNTESINDYQNKYSIQTASRHDSNSTNQVFRFTQNISASDESLSTYSARIQTSVIHPGTESLDQRFYPGNRENTRLTNPTISNNRDEWIQSNSTEVANTELEDSNLRENSIETISNHLDKSIQCNLIEDRIIEPVNDNQIENSRETSSSHSNQSTQYNSAETGFGESRNINRRETDEPAMPACPVCLENFHEVLNQGSHLVAFNCGHVFCNLCTNILMYFRKCPKCRSYLNYRRFVRLHI